MFARTQKKLREATFFLAHLQQETTRLPSPESTEAAAFFLSAFLSAARSVTNVLESEAPEVYKDWSKGWRTSLTEGQRLLLGSFTQARNRALKREAPSLNEAWGEVKTRARSGQLTPAELVFFFGSDAEINEGRTLVGRLTPEEAIAEVLPRCSEYYELLLRLVADFERENSPSSPSTSGADGDA